jgi:hypothetical protein
MTVFDIITQAPENIRADGDTIHYQYFTIDTVDLITFYEWYAFNPLIVTYACDNGEVVGFYNVIPITTECGELFDQQAIKEEDIQIEHLLPIDAMEHTQYVYLASIAIKDRKNYRSRQCAAAMLAAIADNLLNGYDLTKLKRLYANPTTFNGNHMVRKLGLKPVVSYKKPLTGNDIYAIDITPETIERLKYFSQRYSRFIGKNDWSKK